MSDGPQLRMTEGEVAIRLAEYLLTLPGAADTVTIAIDGAVVETVTHGRLFEIEQFLATNGWRAVRQQGKRLWHGAYSRSDKHLHISSTSGIGDVVIQIGNRRVVAECKGGPLVKKRGSQEHRILKEALGQALLWREGADDILLIAVPDTPWFEPLATNWGSRPLVRKVGIQIALVAPSGDVSGFSLV